MRKFRAAPVLLPLLLFSCKTVPVPTPDAPEDVLTLLFAGDIMAHTVNYNMKDYDSIWEDVAPLVQSADFAFANIEAPVDPTRPPSSYPEFNMPKAYVQAAVDAGFDVFSLCNNHTNDQLLAGMRETEKTMKALSDDAAAAGRNIWYSGLKTAPESPYTYNLIEKDGWRILFLPMTEILNRNDYSGYMNYVRSTEAARGEFLSYVTRLRAENPCDLLVLSWHANEPEYTRAVTDEQDAFYARLLDAGVDILWANHAHIIKDRKIILREDGDKIIMYANGNTISGQRTRPDFASRVPDGERDNTGDGLFYVLTLSKAGGSVRIRRGEPHFVTTYISTSGEYLVKEMGTRLTGYLRDNGRTDWAAYIEKRMRIDKTQTKDLIEWQ